MQNTFTITSPVTQPSAAGFRYSTGAADTNGNQKIYHGLKRYICTKSTDCNG